MGKKLENNSSQTPETERDLAQTPWWLIRQLEAITGYTFLLDVCAIGATKKAGYYYGPEDTDPFCLASDCLKADWLEDLRSMLDERVRLSNPATPFPLVPAAFMNNPYSAPTRFMAAAAKWSGLGVPVVGVVKDDRSTRWYRKYIRETATYILEPDGRVPFVKPDGTPFLTASGDIAAANFPVICPVWTKVRPRGPAQIIPFELALPERTPATATKEAA